MYGTESILLPNCIYELQDEQTLTPENSLSNKAIRITWKKARFYQKVLLNRVKVVSARNLRKVREKFHYILYSDSL